MVSEGFVTGLSLAMTRPAAMAACARARLSNRPRSTRRTSARLRGGGMVSAFRDPHPVRSVAPAMRLEGCPRATAVQAVILRDARRRPAGERVLLRTWSEILETTDFIEPLASRSIEPLGGC